VPQDNVLEFGKKLRVKMVPSETRQFKFFFDPFVNGSKSGCQYAAIEGIPYVGDPDLSIAPARLYDPDQWPLVWSNHAWEVEAYLSFLERASS